MPKILAFTPTRAATPQRLALLRETVEVGKRTAGVDFDWHIYGLGCSEETHLYLAKLTCDEPAIKYKPRYNVGQHVAWNDAVETARTGGYDYFLRIDDDCEFLTPRWLGKLLEASVVLEDKAIISPIVKGLKSPPAMSEPCTISNFNFKFLRDAIGGVCRLHPLRLLDGYTADVRKPMGAGDATGIATYCTHRTIPMVYLLACRVRHNTIDQETADAQHFSTHALFQHIPFIPGYRRRPVSTPAS